MIENANGIYIDNALAAVDAELLKGESLPLQQIRRELLMMREQSSFSPGYGRYLVDVGLENEALSEQLIQVAYWRSRALKRKR